MVPLSCTPTFKSSQIVLKGRDVIIGTKAIDFPEFSIVCHQGQDTLISYKECSFLNDIKLEESASQVVIRSSETDCWASTDPFCHCVNWKCTALTGSVEDIGVVTENSGYPDVNHAITNGKILIPFINPSTEPLKIKQNQVLTEQHGNSPVLCVVTDMETTNRVTNVCFTTTVDRVPITIDKIQTGSQCIQEQKQQLCDLLNQSRDCIETKVSELGCMINLPMNITEVRGSRPFIWTPYRMSH